MTEDQDRFALLPTGLSRRTLLRGSLLGGAGLAAAALIGCSDDDEDDDSGDGGGGEATSTSTAEGTATEEAMAEGMGRLIQDPDLPFPYEYPDPAGEPKAGGVFVHGTNFANSNSDPAVNTTGGTLNTINPVYDKLLGFKMGPESDTTKLELIPELATDWEVSEDGLTYTFNIREGVKWQNVSPVDGRDFSAEDLKYALDRYKDDSIQAQLFSSVASIEAPGATELVITLNEAAVDFIVPLGTRTVNIFPREIVDDGSIESKPIGTGPMIMTELIDQQEITFEKNPDYWRNIYLDGAHVRMLPDGATRTAEFRVGRIHHGGNMVPTVNDANNLLETNPDIFVSMSRVTGGGHALAINHQNPKFSDDRVRQGLGLAVDRQTMIDIVYGGYGREHGMIPWLFVFDDEPSGDQLGNYMHYDPAEAKKMLIAAGAEDLEFDDRHYNYLASWGGVGEILAQQFAEVGVTMNLVADDYNTYTTLWVGGNLEEASHTSWGPPSVTADGFTYDQLYSTSPGNRWKINDATLDDLTTRQRTEQDPEARRELLKQIYDYDMDKMFRIPMPGYHTIEAIDPRVRFLRFHGALGAATGVYDWTEQLQDMWLDG